MNACIIQEEGGLSLGIILIQFFFFRLTIFAFDQLEQTQMDYDYDANRNDRHNQDGKSSLPVKQYRRRAVRELFHDSGYNSLAL
jgi:hypothetical protein